METKLQRNNIISAFWQNYTNFTKVKQEDKIFELPAETIITSIGYVENDKLFNELTDLDIPVYNLGDSNKVHNIMYAIWNAYEVARNI